RGARRRPRRPEPRRRRLRSGRHARARSPLRRCARRRPAARRRLCPAGAAAARAGPVVIRVLIADDEALVRGGLRMILEAQGDIAIAGEADDGRAALELAARSHPDVVLMDIRMPSLNGLEATSRLLNTVAPVPRI